MDTSIKSLPIVACIVVLISGYHDGLDDTKHSVCYETRLTHFCNDLRTSNNMTSPTDGSFGPNLVINVPSVSRLNLSMNAITTLRFHTSGDIELMVDLRCPFPQGCIPNTNKKCQKVQCKYLQADHAEQFRKNNVHNVTESMQTLILSYNSIRSLNNIFSPLHNLQFLDLSSNFIESLEEAFTKNSKLVTLNLNNNLIETLHKETFKQLRNLQSLDLSSNRLTRLNLDVFEYLNDLLVLRLNDNFHFVNYSDENSFIISAGQKFERLEITEASLSRVPIALTRSIRELDLANNRLQSIQCGEMDSYPLLHILSLKNNKLETVEDDSLGRLEYLIELNLYGNNLNQIPLSLPLTLLRLDLGLNTIKGINKMDLEGLSHLKSLILRDNKIEYIEPFAFSPVTNLEYLDLSNNPIKRLMSSQFSGPKRIVNLQLSQLNQLSCEGIANCLKTLPFTELDHLEVLNLSGSPMLSQQLIHDQSAVQALNHLKELNLVNANVSKLDPELSKHLTRLQKLEVYENPLNCSNSGWLKEWLVSMETNGSNEDWTKNSNTSTTDYVNVRIIFSAGRNAFMQRLERENRDPRTTPKCFSPVEMKGKSLLDIPFFKSTNDSSELSSKGLSGDLNVGTTISQTAGAIPPADKHENTELPLSVIQLKPSIEGSTCEPIDKGAPISNSIMPGEKSNDEVFYLNDEPETSAVAFRLKNDTNITAVRNFDVMHGQEVQFVTAASKRADKTEEIKEGSAKSYTSSEREKVKAGKQEVKSINKTHIELSRLGGRNKNLEVTFVESVPTPEGTERTVIDSSPENTKKSTNSRIREPIKISRTKEESATLHTTVNMFNLKKGSTNGEFAKSYTMPIELPTKSGIMDQTKSSEIRKQRVERQEVTQPLVTTQIFPAKPLPTESTVTQTMPQTSTQKPGKSKPLDEKSSLRQARKKFGKKLKDITTAQPGTSVPSTSQGGTTTYSSKGNADAMHDHTSIENKQVDETIGKSRTSVTKKTGQKKLAATTKTEVPGNSSNIKTPDNNPNKTYSRGNVQITKEAATTKIDKRIVLGDEGLKASSKREDGGKKETGDDATKIHKDTDYVKERTTDVKSHLQSERKGESNSSRRMHVKQASDDGREEIENDRDSKTSNGGKQVGGENTMGASTFGVTKINQMAVKIKGNDSDHDRNERVERNKVNEDAARSSSSTTPKPSMEELKVKHDSSDKAPTLSGRKSISDEYFTRAKYDSNVESKDDLEKGGSHPGMLIFLLIVSVLLFTLSLMLISHWTWCKRLNMYDVSDQQILEESDYEINSLTNFKEPERW